jgi:protein-L-isoaspartate(D-aspartate) O-methyltransferase
MHILATLAAWTGLAAIAPLGGMGLSAAGESGLEEQRRRMLDEIDEEAAASAFYSGVSALSSRVRAAIAAVPRHEFVPPDLRHRAYVNRPLPIGYAQTISQPFIVALMTELLGLRDTDKVLEIGTGSGYQAAVLSLLAREVYTIEIVEPLGEMARTTLARLGYANVRVRTGDGYAGWADEAPFDAIIVTAAPDHVPQPLVQQLKPGGRLVIPVGPPGAVQTLWQFTADAEGQLTAYNLGEVRFVPFTRSAQTP